MEIGPFAPFKILSCYEKINQILRGKMPIPQTLDLFVSNRCNHSCIGCHSKVSHNTETAFLDLKIIKKTFKEVAELGVKGIEISGGGEPLMHPEILKIVKAAVENKFKIGIFTNGALLNDRLIKEFVNDLLFIRIAFESADSSLYKEIHGKNDFSKVIENIKKLVAQKRKVKAKLSIGLKMLISEFNYAEIINVAKMAKLLKADYMQFKLLRKSLQTIPDNKIILVKETIDKAIRLFCNKSFKIHDFTKKTLITKRCFLNPLHPTIDTSGDVYLCYFFQHRKDTHRIGNLYRQSFREIWYSKRHFNAFKNNNYRKCRDFDCPLQAPLGFINEAIINNKMHLEFI